MTRVVVDTDVASYIFNWHSSAQGYVDALRGSELILSFMSVAEMRMGCNHGGMGAAATGTSRTVHRPVWRRLRR